MSAPARTVGFLANMQSHYLLPVMDGTGRQQPSPSRRVGHPRVNGCPDANARAVAMSMCEGVPPSSLSVLRLRSEMDRIWSEVCFRLTEATSDGVRLVYLGCKKQGRLLPLSPVIRIELLRFPAPQVLLSTPARVRMRMTYFFELCVCRRSCCL